MKNSKLYLFAYLCIDPISKVEKVTRRTDQNIALFGRDGNNIKLLWYIELERYTRIKKHSISFASVDECKSFLDCLLKQEGYCLDDIDVIWGTKELQKGIDEDTLLKLAHVLDNEEFYPHTIFHLSSCMKMETDLDSEDMLAFAVDGGPDFVNLKNSRTYQYAGCVRRNNKFEMFPAYSPGPLWALAKNTFGMKEGTLMALAGACKSAVYAFNEGPPLISKSSELKKGYDYFQKLIQYARKAIDSNKSEFFSGFDEAFTEQECFMSCVMKEIQNASYRIMDINMAEAVNRYHIEPSKTLLALSGGFALNCPNNTRMVEKYGFKSFEAPPCVNDSGISLGMGLFFFAQHVPGFSFALSHSYYGNKEGSEETECTLKEYSKYIKSITPFSLDTATVDLDKNPVVWIEGRAEIGPRALGHRSILADPRKIENKWRLNSIKKRPMWQPVAPIVVSELGSDWFENYFASPFMLHIFRFKSDKKDLVPAITHLDDTARVQSIKRDDAEYLYQLLQNFYKRTGIPFLCNTSLNDRGEPIINNLREGLNFALCKEIEVVYFNGQRIELMNHQEFNKSEYAVWPFHEFFTNEESREESIRLNPMRLSQSILHFYYTSPELMNKYRIDVCEDAKAVNRIVSSIFRTTGLDSFLAQD